MTFLPVERHMFKFSVLTINSKGAAALVYLPFPKMPFEFLAPVLGIVLEFSFCLQLNSSIPLNNREPSLLFQQPSIGRSLELSYQMPCKELVLGGNSRQ